MVSQKMDHYQQPRPKRGLHPREKPWIFDNQYSSEGFNTSTTATVYAQTEVQRLTQMWTRRQAINAGGSNSMTLCMCKAHTIMQIMKYRLYNVKFDFHCFLFHTYFFISLFLSFSLCVFLNFCLHLLFSFISMTEVWVHGWGTCSTLIQQTKIMNTINTICWETFKLVSRLNSWFCYWMCSI